MRDDSTRVSAALDEALTALEDAPATRSGDRWTGTLSGFAPVQGRGTVDGHKWYFRSRDGVWRFEVSDIAESELVLFILRGVDANNGMMPFSVAWRIIEESIAAWRAER